MLSKQQNAFPAIRIGTMFHTVCSPDLPDPPEAAQQEQNPHRAVNALWQGVTGVRGISPDWMRGLESCVCSSSFTRSIGATAVLDTAPATPPAIRSAKKRNAGEAGGPFSLGAAMNVERSLPHSAALSFQYLEHQLYPSPRQREHSRPPQLSRAHGRRASKALCVIGAIHCRIHRILLCKAAEVPVRKGCLITQHRLLYTAAHSQTYDRQALQDTTVHLLCAPDTRAYQTRLS